MADEAVDPNSGGIAGLHHPERYTITPDDLSRYRDYSLFRLNMDTWYYSEWADPNHFASLGRVALGDGPLTAAQGVAAFVARQVTDFRDAFAGLFRPVAVRVGYKPYLSGVGHPILNLPAPETPADVQAIQTMLEQSAATYEGITFLGIDFMMRATLRDDDGQLAEVWLPYSGEASYRARYFDGYRSNLPQSVAVTYLLTPSAQAGIAPWDVDLHCNFLSLFCADNTEVLARVRGQWQQWLQTHPDGADGAAHESQERENDESGDVAAEREDAYEVYVITLAVPPHGTPPDNRELGARNAPRLRAAVARWEERLGTSFEWAVTL